MKFEKFRCINYIFFIICFCIIGCVPKKITVVNYNLENLPKGNSDVLGWEDITWGMTYNDALKIYDLFEITPVKRRKNSYRSEFKKPLDSKFESVKEGKNSSFLYLRENTTNTIINGILLQSSTIKSPTDFLDSEHKKILDGLIFKYGMPDEANKCLGDRNCKTYIWKKQSGILRVFFHQLMINDGDSIFIMHIFLKPNETGK